MPEQDKKELGLLGEVTTTPSSDEAIEAKLGEITREIHGIPHENPMIEGEALKPVLVGSNTGGLKSVPENIITFNESATLGPDDSRFGLSILNRRSLSLQKKKAA